MNIKNSFSRLKHFCQEHKNDVFPILTLALPTILDMFVQTLLGFFDLVMVGKLGPESIAAVGLGSAPITAIMPVFFALSIGTAAIVSRAFGSKNYDEAKEGVSQSLILALPVSLVVTFLFIAFGEPLLRAIGKNQPLDQALEYFNVVSLGLPFLGFNIIFSYGFRSINKAKIPMINNTISIFTNIALNYIFIFSLNLGVLGAGIATTISRGLSFVIFCLLIYYKKSYPISLTKKNFKVRKDICQRLIKVGLPSAGEQALFRIGMFIFEVMVINLGTLAYAAHKIALTAESFSFNLGFGFAVAATTMVGQYMGTQDFNNAKSAGYLNTLLGVGVMTIFGFSFMLFPSLIISMFTNDYHIMPMASSALRIVSIAQPILAMSMVFSGALRGAGDTKSVLWITSFGVFFIRLPLTYLFLYKMNMGLNGAWIAMVFDLLFRSIVGYEKFKNGKWKYIQV